MSDFGGFGSNLVAITMQPLRAYAVLGTLLVMICFGANLAQGHYKGRAGQRPAEDWNNRTEGVTDEDRQKYETWQVSPTNLFTTFNNKNKNFYFLSFFLSFFKKIMKMNIEYYK